MKILKPLWISDSTGKHVPVKRPKMSKNYLQNVIKYIDQKHRIY